MIRYLLQMNRPNYGVKELNLATKYFSETFIQVQKRIKLCNEENY